MVKTKTDNHKNDKKRIWLKPEKISYIYKLSEVINAVTSYSIKNNIPVEDVDLTIEYSRGYYDSVETYLELSGSRLETDEEFNSRIEIENNLNLELKEKEKTKKKAAEEAEKKEFARLTKKFKGEEIDPTTI